MRLGSSTLAIVALLVGLACTDRPPPRSSAGVDPEHARTAVIELSRAVAHGDTGALERLLSFADLARSTRPAEVRSETPVVLQRFTGAAMRHLLAPESALRGLVAGLEVVATRAQGTEAVVEARGTAGEVRFTVAPRGRELRVVRIE
jgi:hypothetical protein